MYDIYIYIYICSFIFTFMAYSPLNLSVNDTMMIF